MPAAIYDLTIEQGADYSKSFLLKNPDGSVKDISNTTARMQIRRYVFDTDFLLSIVSTGGSPGIVINVPTGSVTVKLTNAQTANLNIKRAVYDLELISSTGEVTRLIQGSVIVNPEVTR